MVGVSGNAIRAFVILFVGVILAACQGSSSPNNVNTSSAQKTNTAPALSLRAQRDERKTFAQQREEILQRFRERREKAKAERERRRQAAEERRTGKKKPAASATKKPTTKKAGKKRVAKRSKSTKRRGRPQINALIAKYARQEGIPLKLAHAVVQVESSYRVNARGGVGEIGLMQLRLSTARMMGYRGSAKALYNPELNIKYGMKYLGKARRLARGNTCGTILRYNAGHGAKRMNPISRRYCTRVKRIMRG